MTPPDPVPVLAQGAHLSPDLQVVTHLSRGKALDVYDAWSFSRACRVVAKTLRPDRATEPHLRRRLLREGRLLRHLTHPHIVRAYDVLTEPAPVVVLETLTGATLSALIDERRWRQLPVRQVALLGVQLASALRYLHANKVVHCDLKPGNVIAEAGRAKVIDLSLARRPGRGRQGAGTRDYMAPEQARGEWISTATDVWGLGARCTTRPPATSRSTAKPRSKPAGTAIRRLAWRHRRSDPTGGDCRTPSPI